MKDDNRTSCLYTPDTQKRLLKLWSELLESERIAGLGWKGRENETPASMKSDRFLARFLCLSITCSCVRKLRCRAAGFHSSRRLYPVSERVCMRRGVVCPFLFPMVGWKKRVCLKHVLESIIVCSIKDLLTVTQHSIFCVNRLIEPHCDHYLVISTNCCQPKLVWGFCWSFFLSINHNLS